MNNLDDNTIRLNDNDSCDNGNTVRLDQTEKIDGNTVRIDETVIPSGLSGGINAAHIDNQEIKLKGKAYRIVTKISEKTTEAQIYLIERDAEQFVLKYYYPFIQPKEDIVKKIRSFNHPDIINVIDYGFHEERFYEILEYADQGSLAEHLPIRDKKLIKKFLKEISQAIDYCHQNGIIHRDLKPSNLFITNEKKLDLMLGDFGIASIMNEDEVFRRTNIFYTPIYAAPEYRMNLRGETVITKAVDFYALGITLWEIWSGKLPPSGMDDLEFLRLMFEGEPPLPSGMDDEIAYLIKGLTAPKYKNRWGIEQVNLWLKGEYPDLPKNENSVVSKIFDFGEVKDGKRLKAGNTSELAEIIYKYPELGRMHLYRGTIKDWLKETGNNKVFAEIADVTEYKYKNDEYTGTAFSVYILDRNFPYFAIDGTSCKNKNEIINVLIKNYKKYQKILTDKNDHLYLYLRSKNAGDLADKLYDYFEQYKPEEAVHYLIYNLQFSINPNMPFKYMSNKGEIEFVSIEQLADFIYDFPKEGLKIVTDIRFPIWLSFRSPELFNEFNKLKKQYGEKSDHFIKSLPYTLDKERGYEGLDGNMCFNLVQFGEEFFNHFEEYKTILQDRNSKIYYYLQVKGYDGEYEYFYEVFKMEDFEGRPSPYNENVAMYKIINGVGFNTYYEFMDKKISNTDELYHLRKELGNEIKKELDDRNSRFTAWLSCFFHEFTMNPDNTMYMYTLKDFDERLEQFIQFVKKLSPKCSISERYSKAEKKAAGIGEDLILSPTLSKYIYQVFLLLPLAASALVLAYSYFSPEIYLPFNAFSISKWYYIIFIAGTILFLFNEDFDFDGIAGCIGSVIVGLIAAVIFYYIFYMILAHPLLLLGLLGAAFYFLYRFIDNKLYAMESMSNSDQVISNRREINYLIYNYAFGKTNSIKTKQSESLEEIKTSRRNILLSIVGVSLGYTILLLGILFLLLYHDPYIFK